MTTTSFIDIAVIISIGAVALFALSAVSVLVKRLAQIFIVVCTIVFIVPAANGGSINVIEVCELLKPWANPCRFLQLLEWAQSLR